MYAWYIFHRILKTSHISTTHNCLQVYEFLPVNYSFMLSVDLQKMLGGYSSLSVPSVHCNLHMYRFNYFDLVLTQRLCLPATYTLVNFAHYMARLKYRWKKEGKFNKVTQCQKQNKIFSFSWRVFKLLHESKSIIFSSFMCYSLPTLEGTWLWWMLH